MAGPSSLLFAPRENLVAAACVLKDRREVFWEVVERVGGLVTQGTGHANNSITFYLLTKFSLWKRRAELRGSEWR